jgi:hypothetical protein
MMTDNHGNKLYRLNDQIKLHLVSEKSARVIAKIDEENKLLEVRRLSKKHLFIKGNAYGFNDSLLRTATKFDKVKLIIDNKEEYLIPLEIIKEKGKYLFFNQQGFELQIFISLNDLENYKL